MEKLTAQITGAYLGCQFRYSGSIGKIRTMGGVARTLNLIDYDTQETFHTGRCQLILTPLSEITDEDAIDVAKLLCNAYYGITANQTQIEKVKDRVKVFTGGRGVCSIWNNGAIGWFNSENEQTESPLQLREAYDFLRSRSYDCGYGKISSLIAAGIAIAKTE